ncbi:MAG: sulfatase [Myxococcota bacterium]
MANPMGFFAGLGLRLLASSVAFGLLGVVDWALAAARSDRASLPGLPLVVGLWLAAALPWALVASLVARVTLGPAGHRPLLALLAPHWRRVVAETGTPADTARLANLAGVTKALVIFAAASILLVRWYILHRHGALLIALATVAGQAALLVPALAFGLIARRTTHALFTRARARGRLLRVGTATLIRVSAFITLAALVALAAVAYRTYIAIDGPTFTLPLVALAIAAALAARLRAAPLATWLLPVLAAAAIALSASSTAARRLAGQDAWTARWAAHALLPTARQAASDDLAPASPYPPPRRPSQVPPGPAPNIILVTFDALRADHTGFMGYPRPTSPRLDAFAADAVVFEHAYSQDSGTGPSLWSLMTGKTPFQVDLLHPERFPPAFGASEQLLAEQLEQAGYSTAAVLCGDVFGTPHWNLRRGFDEYADVCVGHSRDQAPIVRARALSTIRRFARKQPFFVWVHFYDPHGPYADHADVDFGSQPMDLYDEEIRYADRGFGELLDGLAAQDLGRRTFIAVTADHGEGFGKHGPDPHARNLYRNVTHVPLVIHGPGIAPRRVSDPVAMADLFPTLLDLASVPVPLASTMASQAPVLFGEAPDPDRIVFQENSYSRPRRDTKGAIWQRWHMIMDLTTGVEELYDLRADPDELRDRIGDGEDAEAKLRRELRAFITTTRVPDDLSK